MAESHAISVGSRTELVWWYANAGALTRTKPAHGTYQKL